MLIESLRIFLNKPKKSRHSRDWNTQRQESLRTAEEPADESERIRSELSQMHWLSLVCFLEEADPQLLLLWPELLTRVTREVTQLRSLDALQVTVLVLEHLSRCEIVEDCPGGDDAEAA